ncbi:UDP-N-acetylglucosamine 4,6-dehydratase (inverting) [Candidatus Pelagibacter sp.]|nr:UDP-N-acetylglucosamine 4,6-dehydratase (inverting) [Candidatus Pelagibacter sp.]
MQKKNSYLITGGTGSFGKAFVKKIINSKNKVSRLVIFSRDELKQYEMSQLFPREKYPFIRYFLGDVRDENRILAATENIETIIHAAALKQVPTTEYNPFEAIKTNILGANNVIQASIKNNVKNVIALSTDKACSPINLYGATKLCSDKLFISANNIKGNRKIKFCVVRYGNVLGSRGSVIPFFLKNKSKGILPITDKEMTRFNITLDYAVDTVIWSLKNLSGGELLVPKLPSYRILDLANAISFSSKKKIIGIRPGEKIHEEMISLSDSQNTIELKNYYLLLPSLTKDILTRYKKKFNARLVKKNFTYSSNKNTKFLSIKELKQLILDYQKYKL